MKYKLLQKDKFQKKPCCTGLCTCFSILAILLVYLLFNSIIKTPVEKKHVWCHRGYSETSSDENSVKSINDAIMFNFTGVELDIFYDKILDDFIVSAYSYNTTAPNKPTLHDLFLAAGSDLMVWLDVKNLSPDNAHDFNRKIKYYKENYDVDFFVESWQYGNLFTLSSGTNIQTAYEVFHCLQLLLPQWFTYTSMTYTVYEESPALCDLLSRNPIHLSTINDEDKLNEYYKRERVSILLTDTNINENNFKIA
tara:strand:- start:9 stop:764 length:756 start_codon:yes stop_codon:yes gene_type:complete